MSPKIRRHLRNKSCSILKLSKNIFYKKCAPKLVFNDDFFLEIFGRFFGKKIDFVLIKILQQKIQTNRNKCGIRNMIFAKYQKHISNVFAT